jgi:hypothetical protein
MSAWTTFCSAMTLRSMILAWTALRSSSVLCRTFLWELIADMILQKSQQEFCQKKKSKKKNILVRLVKNFGRVTVGNGLIKK